MKINSMKNKGITCLLALLALLTVSCNDDDDNVINYEMSLDGLTSSCITSKMQGDSLIWTWPKLQEGLSMDITVTKDGQPFGHESTQKTSALQMNVETNAQYEYVFRITDGNSTSDGIVKKFTRQGASTITGLTAEQAEGTDGYEAHLTWDESSNAKYIKITATNGTRTVCDSIAGDTTDYSLPGVTNGEEWQFTLVAGNDKGCSLTSTTSLKVGKTAVAFLSIYATPEDLIANGDDDEAAAWLWFHKEYPNSKYLYFGDIKSADDLSNLRELFWIRDLNNGTETTAWTQPQVVTDATPFIQEWYKNGGNLLLWQHAVTYITDLGRIDRTLLKNNDRRITIGNGDFNTYQWYMAVQINPGSHFVADFSSHPLYKGLDVIPSGRTKVIPVKGACWTEDHNVCFFNIPTALTGLNNQTYECYEKLTKEYGIYPLGIWDSQIDWVSQLNVWEARQGNTEFKGNILCIGNGGCEFSHQNADGTADKNAFPKNNQYQSTILTMAKNAIEYLKTI